MVVNGKQVKNLRFYHISTDGVVVTIDNIMFFGFLPNNRIGSVHTKNNIRRPRQICFEEAKSLLLWSSISEEKLLENVYNFYKRFKK